MSPQQMALAFRIWQYAEPLGWDCTAGEIAEAIGSTPQAVAHICKAKDWTTRIRKTAWRAEDRTTIVGFSDAIFGGGLTSEITAGLNALADEAGA